MNTLDACNDPVCTRKASPDSLYCREHAAAAEYPGALTAALHSAVGTAVRESPRQVQVTDRLVKPVYEVDLTFTGDLVRDAHHVRVEASKLRYRADALDEIAAGLDKLSEPARG